MLVTQEQAPSKFVQSKLLKLDMFHDHTENYKIVKYYLLKSHSLYKMSIIEIIQTFTKFYKRDGDRSKITIQKSTAENKTIHTIQYIIHLNYTENDKAFMR